MEKFGEIHEKEIGGKVGKGGLPDQGSGRYTMEFGYATWLKMMLYQRAHLNYFESLLQVLFYILAGGLQWPVVFAIMGGVYLFGRIIFVIGYYQGARARMWGALIIMPLQFAMPIVTIVAMAILGAVTCS